MTSSSTNAGSGDTVSLGSSDSNSSQQQHQIEQLRNRVDAVLASMVGVPITVGNKAQQGPIEGSDRATGPLGLLRSTPSPPLQGLSPPSPSNLPEGKHWVVDPYGDQGQYEGGLKPKTDENEEDSISEKLPHGHGKMEYTDGRIYEGEWKNGHWHGQGKAVFSNRDTYIGNYYQDQRHGKGLYEWSDGRVYKGEFHMDQRQGKGLYTWPDGAKYSGEFFKGLRHGQGDYTFRDGSIYSGEWQKGKYHGHGECHWSDGRIYKGEWAAGKAHGSGIEIRPDGSIRHDGKWENDKPIREPKGDALGDTRTSKTTLELLQEG